MGVWERSPAGIEISNKNKGLLEDFRRALPDFKPQDNVGSPYCVRNYVVDAHLGGPKGLAAARQELAKRGMKLLLDFVPNHVAPDHPWATDHPDYLIRGTSDDARNNPASFIEVEGNVFACGRDPFFPAWPDVLQVKAFEPGFRKAAVETVSSIAAQCDGVRCDMAMLMLNRIFERTWGGHAGRRPATEYWDEVSRRSSARSRISALSQKLIGTSSGSCNSTVSTSVTTSDFMIGWSMTARRVSGFIFLLNFLTSRSSSVLLRTTTSPARQQHSRLKKNALPPLRLRRFPEPDYFMKDNLKAGRRNYRYFWGDVRKKLRIQHCCLSTRRC